MAADVCAALDLTNTTVALDSLDEDERSKFNLGRQGEVNLINEPGLYSLILRSRKPEAKAFKRWGRPPCCPSIATQSPCGILIDAVDEHAQVFALQFQALQRGSIITGRPGLARDFLNLPQHIGSGPPDFGLAFLHGYSHSFSHTRLAEQLGAGPVGCLLTVTSPNSGLSGIEIQ